jgi:hypothetical protein
MLRGDAALWTTGFDERLAECKCEIKPGATEEPDRSARGNTFHFCKKLGTSTTSTERKVCVTKRCHGIRSVAADHVQYDGAMIVVIRA